jgi:hypothetical protein
MGTPFSEPQGMSPLMRQWGQPNGRSTKRRRCFTESVTTSTLSVGASCYGPRRSRSGQLLSGRGCKRSSGTST